MLLQQRTQGIEVDMRESMAAREILSGPPKRDAIDLVSFLKGGAFTLHAT